MGRDPDTIVSVTEHEKENTYTVDFNLRDFKQVPPITIRVAWPNVFKDFLSDPKALKTTKYTAKYTCEDILRLISVKPYTTTELQKELREELGMASGTFYSLWRDVKKTEGVAENNEKKWFYNMPACNPSRN